MRFLEKRTTIIVIAKVKHTTYNICLINRKDTFVMNNLIED